MIVDCKEIEICERQKNNIVSMYACVRACDAGCDAMRCDAMHGSQEAGCGRKAI